MNKPWFSSYDKNVPQSLTYPEITLPDFLLQTTQQYPQSIATTYNNVDITYGELNQKVNSLAYAMKALGISRGDRVAFLLPNSPTYVIAFYATAKLGAVVVNLNVTTMGEELIRVLEDSGAKLAVTLDMFLKNVLAVADKSLLKHIIIHSVFGLEKSILAEKTVVPVFVYSQLITQYPNTDLPLECRPDDLAVLQYTSGSTGFPKAAMLTHRNIVSAVIQIKSWNPVKKPVNPAILCIIPFFHVFGMTICLHLSICEGFRMVLYPIFDWSSIITFLQDIQKYQPISFPAVPALWAALVSHSEAMEYKLSCIEIASGGGAPLSEWVQKKYTELTGKHIMQAYGLSEVCGAATLTPFRGIAITESIGLPLPDTDIRIVDVDSGQDCTPGEVGEIVIRGPQVMKGYWNNPKRTAEVLKDGWLYTGDLARMDENGYLYIVDRKDDLIITNGFNVYPSDIENVLMRHEKIRECGIVGIPDQIRGEAIVAYVVPKENENLTAKEVLEFCRRHLADYKVPRYVRFIDAIPVDRIGKALKKELRKNQSPETET